MAQKNSTLKTVLDILWLIFIGFVPALWLFFFGAILYITVIGIPFGTQLFKIAKVIAFPFNSDPTVDPMKHPVMNIIWAIFFGWETALYLFVVGLILCITVIGLPVGKSVIKIAKVMLVPFGAKV